MDGAVRHVLKTVLATLFEALLNTFLFFGTSFLPILLLCLSLLLLGRWMNRRLLESFGWQGVLLGAWIGTPVHEFSHMVGCWVGRNKVEDFALFKPDQKSSSLGYVRHSYDAASFYQRVIGNTLIAVAPFFGGSLVICLLTTSFYPNLVISDPQRLSIDIETFTSFRNVVAVSAAWINELKHFLSVLFSASNLGHWQFWLYLFAMISLAAHLSPSRSDFEGLGKPLLILLALLVTGEIALVAARRLGWFESTAFHLSPVIFIGLLVLALMFLLLGATAVGLLTFVWNHTFGVKNAGKAGGRA